MKILTIGLVIRTSLTAMAIIALSGCASSPEIQTSYDPGSDFSQYQTYAFLASEPAQDKKSYKTLKEKYIEEGIRQELNAKGLKEVKHSSNANTLENDLYIAYDVASKEKVSAMLSPLARTRYYDRRHGWSYGYHNQTVIQQYTEGTLTIDIIDKKENQLIWRGVAIDRKRGSNNNHLKPKITETIETLFEQYPSRTN